MHNNSAHVILFHVTKIKPLAVNDLQLKTGRYLSRITLSMYLQMA